MKSADESSSAGRAWIGHALCGALYLALALAGARGLLADVNGRIQSLGDPLLNAYILDWSQYALFHQLAEFFHANVFWPHEYALAYGEHLISPALLALPLRGFAGGPVALHNLSVVQAFFFSALAAHALGFHYLKSVRGALLTGLLYGFAPYRLAQSGHIQLIHGEFLPLAVLAFERLRDSRRGAWGALLAFGVAGQGLCSWYWAVFTFWGLGLYMAGRVWQGRAVWLAERGAALKRLAIPLVAAGLVLIVVAIPYAVLRHRNVLIRPPEKMDRMSARPADFAVKSDLALWPGAAAWMADAAGFTPETQPSERLLGLGDAMMGGLLCALWLARRRGARAVPLRLWLGVAGLLMLFAFGRSVAVGGREILMPYAAVERFFPFASAMRVPARWMAPALLPMALAAAYGWVHVLGGIGAIGAKTKRVGGGGQAGAWRSQGQAAVVVNLVCLLAVVESLSGGGRFVTVESKPRGVDRRIAAAAFPAPVLELPEYARDDNRAMLHAAWHRQPTVNGSNGFYPPGHTQQMALLETFPASEAVAELRRTKVRFVVIDLARLAKESGGDAGAEAYAAACAKALGAGAKIESVGETLLIDLEEQGANTRGK